ncbi:hypothetical protein [Spirosoma montaniterrae]|uniref:DUF5678 domain-containing protein n=1 Tax=Spirosoma montaniterrae TaxID=1178516 RepID=A0A1P9WWS1_9BACT|nr:hypothetical protein [Spirosoma montaniterrae]AQG79790.1 hypothetical protein AWR27_10910 [Spirosoma montaniterrae]
MNTLTIDQIKAQYPDEWVLVGNPSLSGATVLGGIVIDHSKDKREIAYRQPNWRAQFQSAITVFTGDKPKNRKFWL